MSGRKRKYPSNWDVPEDIFAEHSESPERRVRQQLEARHGTTDPRPGDPSVAPFVQQEAQGEHGANLDDEDNMDDSPTLAEFRDDDVDRGELQGDGGGRGGPVTLNFEDERHDTMPPGSPVPDGFLEEASSSLDGHSTDQDGVNEDIHEDRNEFDIPDYILPSPNGK